MAKFNPTITAYLVPYTTKGHDNKKFCYWVSLLLKVEHISYTMSMPDIYCTHLPPGLAVLRQVRIYQAKHLRPWYCVTITYILYIDLYGSV